VAETLPKRGLLRVVPPAQLESQIQEQNKQQAEADQSPAPTVGNLAAFVRTQFDLFRQHRNDARSGWSERLLRALRAFNGQYDPDKLAQIQKFTGSQIYARLIAMKCRGASSLLRDVYLSPERCWGIDPPTDPEVPDQIVSSIGQLVQSELSTLSQAGQPADVNTIRDRVQQLMLAARDAAKKRASKQAKVAEEKIDELLISGGFYKALAEFLVDLPVFPFACIKGPTVRIVPSVSWQNGTPTIDQKPRLFWQRVSPFDLWWTPGAADIEDAAVIERTRVTRADLNDLLDLPGYNTDEIRAVLDEYGRGGLADNWDNTDAERAVQENRENPQLNRSGMISCLEYNGNIQGQLLIEYGMDPSIIQDPLRDYMVQLWIIGTHVIKVQLTPSPRRRHPYFITSFEKVPGTPVGNGLTDILNDLQEAANATLRSLVNNMSLASGPQVVVNDDRLAAGEDGEELFPWKRWHVEDDPLGNNTQVPISFFQPVSNAQELLAVYQKLNDMADDISAIPRYLSGQSPGGAGRTASGLAMLMGNASKILQTVAANIDRDVFDPLLTTLFDLIMLTDTSGILTGEENVRVMGVNVAIQRETERSRQIEFLQITANPMDAQIMGPQGRAVVLRSVAQKIGLDGENIIPNPDDMPKGGAPAASPPGGAPGSPAAPNMASAGAAAQGNQHGPSSTGDMGPRTNTVAGGAG